MDTISPFKRFVYARCIKKKDSRIEYTGIEISSSWEDVSEIPELYPKNNIINHNKSIYLRLSTLKLFYFRILFLIFFAFFSLNLISKEFMFGNTSPNFYDDENFRRKLSRKQIEELRIALYSCDWNNIDFACFRLPKSNLESELQRAISHGDRSLSSRIADELARRNQLMNR